MDRILQLVTRFLNATVLVDLEQGPEPRALGYVTLFPIFILESAAEKSPFMVYCSGVAPRSPE